MDGYSEISASEDRWTADAPQDDEGDDASDGAAGELPPTRVGQDERRMQLRAHHLWASLRGPGSFPRIEDLTAAGMADFAEHTVVLDLTTSAAEPVVMVLGAKLADECGAAQGMQCLSDVPAASLLTRMTERYREILAARVPIGFESEFIDQRGRTLACRGILLPCSNDGETIEQILGVINWKEVADAKTMAALMRELQGQDQTPESSLRITS